MPKYFGNPNFSKYVRLLTQLHALKANNADKGIEGEDLRDELDACGEFSDNEAFLLQEISAEFRLLHELFKIK